jgi:hypothetical protein
VKPHPKVSPEKYRLMESIRTRQYGDAVEIVAKPIAKVADKIFGTNLANCGTCRERKEAWNNEKGHEEIPSHKKER